MLMHSDSIDSICERIFFFACSSSSRRAKSCSESEPRSTSVSRFAVLCSILFNSFFRLFNVTFSERSFSACSIAASASFSIFSGVRREMASSTISFSIRSFCMDFCHSFSCSFFEDRNNRSRYFRLHLCRYHLA